jgi:cysteine desulfuration protein SufE
MKMPVNGKATSAMDDIQNEIIGEMSALDDWMDKYEYLIGLGGKILSPNEEIRNEKYALKGCQASVWIKAELINGSLCFLADSDSKITKGMIALLLRVLNNRLPEEIADADLYFISKTGLATNLSPTRANGLALIVKQMKELGSSYVSNGG